MVLLYRLFAELDRIVFMLVSQIIPVIDDLSKYNFFSVETVKTFTRKVYIVIGILMLFKLVISAIQYLVSPDSFGDKNKGAGALLQKTVICVALLVLVPSIFDFGMSLQTTIVKQIPNVVFGNEINQSEIQDIGEKISVSVLGSFLSLKSGRTTKVSLNKVADFPSLVLEECPNDIFNGSYWTLDDCNYDYYFLISTATGVFMLYVLLSMAIDIGIRTIKFGLVQILAPIPIVSYISDEKKFNNWVKTSLQIYADLFIRMAVVYFVVYFISVVLKDFLNSTVNPTELVDAIGRQPETLEFAAIKVFIIVAVLLFAKNAPKFICDLLGFDKASESMSEMFKRAGGLFGTTVAGIRTARSNFTTQKERAEGKGYGKGRQVAEGLRSAIAGFGSATGRGMFMSAQGKGFSDVKQNAFKNAINARNKRNDKLDNIIKTDIPEFIDDPDGKLDNHGNVIQVRNPEYYNRQDYRRDVRREKLGIPSGTAFVKTRYDVMEQIAKVAADSRSHGGNKMNETPNRYQVSFMEEKDGRLVFKNSDFAAIQNALGYDSLSMEQVRNLYTMARNGQEIDHKNGTTKVKLNASQIDSLGSILQIIEKRTSYLKEAELMATGDPAATPNVEKMAMAIANNITMFNDPSIMRAITLKTKGKVTDKEGLLKFVKSLETKITEPKRADFTSDISYNNAMTEYFKQINDRADILNNVKDAFEEVTKQQYTPAQVADARAKKAQQAISNNEKK